MRRPTSSGRSAASRCTVDLFDPGAVAARGGRPRGRRQPGHEHPARSPRRPRGAAWATNERLRTRGVEPPRRRAPLAAGAAAVRPGVDLLPVRRRRGPAGSTRTTRSTTSARSPARGTAEAAARALRRRRAASGVVLRFAQFYAPDSTHTQAFNATACASAINPFLGARRGLHARSSTPRTPGPRWSPRCGRRAASTTWPTTSRVTRAEAGRIVAEALGVKPPHTAAEARAGGEPRLGQAPDAVAAHLERALQGRRPGWTPAHPSIRGSWPA